MDDDTKYLRTWVPMQLRLEVAKAKMKMLGDQLDDLISVCDSFSKDEPAENRLERLKPYLERVKAVWYEVQNEAPNLHR